VAERSYYLKLGLSGGGLEGASADPGHPGWLDISGFNFGGVASDGPRRLNEITFTKVDAEDSPDLYKEVLTGGLGFDGALLHYVAGKDSGWWEFRGAYLTHAAHGGLNVDGKPVDLFTMEFDGVEYHVGSPLAGVRVVAAVVGALGDAAGAVARHMLLLHQARLPRKK
jgi:hypothetical protein